MTTRRYAEGTDVPVERSRAEMSGLLTRHGVQRQGWLNGPEGDQLGFALHGRSYRFAIDKPDVAWARANAGPRTESVTAIEREWRRRWRATVLLLKAKLEFADGETTTVEREFLPYLLTAGGRTIGELVDDGVVQQAIGVPLLLLPEVR